MNSISFFKALLMKELNEKDLPGNQEKIAQAAEPKDKITAADFAALRAKKGVKKEAAPVKQDVYGMDPNLDVKADKDLPGSGMTEGGDHEVSMAHNSLESIIRSAMELKSKLGDNERDIPGWIQDHITNAENYIDQASQGFHELHGGEHDFDELPDGTVEVPAGDEEDAEMSLQSMMEDLLEAKKKPSAGLSKKQKSAIVKKAKSGKDIGKKGKGFEKVMKAAEKGGADNPRAVAAAAMWKGAAKKAK